MEDVITIFKEWHKVFIIVLLPIAILFGLASYQGKYEVLEDVSLSSPPQLILREMEKRVVIDDPEIIDKIYTQMSNHKKIKHFKNKQLPIYQGAMWTATGEGLYGPGDINRYADINAGYVPYFYINSLGKIFIPLTENDYIETGVERSLSDFIFDLLKLQAVK